MTAGGSGSAAKAVLSVGVLRLVSFGIAALFLAGVAATVPATVYGQFALALSLLQTASGALLSWPNQGFLRFGREEFAAEGRLGGSMAARLALHAGVLCILLPVTWAAAPAIGAWIGIDGERFRPLAVAALLVLPLSDLGGVAAQAAGRFFAYGLVPVVQRGIQLVAIALIFTGVTPGWEILLLATVAGTLGGALIAWRSVPFAAWKGLSLESIRLRTQLSYGWLIPLATLAAYLLTWMDPWFIRYFLDPAAVGIYSWAYSATMLATNLLIPVAVVLGPRMIDLRVAEDEAAERRLLDGIFSACLVTAALMPAAIGLLAYLLSVVPQGNYGAAAPTLMILVASAAFQMGMALLEPWVYAQASLVPRMVAITVVMVMIKAGCDLLLIPRLGIEGAAVATAASYGGGMILQWWLVPRLRSGRRIPLFLVIALVPVVLAVVDAALAPAAALLTGAVASLLLVVGGRCLGLYSALVDILPRRIAGLLCWLLGRGAA